MCDTLWVVSGGMNYPKHIAFIPDGNRTWAKQKWLPQMAWHLEGQTTSVKLMHHIFTKTPIQVATFWWLSTENTKNRSREELDYLSELYEVALDTIDDLLTKEQVSFRWIWSPVWLSEKVIKVLQDCEKKHAYDTDRTLVIAINYGGRDEILRWMKTLIDQNITAEELTAQRLSKVMDLWDLPWIELVVRTKGEYAQRTSWFASRWIGYAEIYFAEQFFPDMKPELLDQALERFDKKAGHRNYGK